MPEENIDEVFNKFKESSEYAALLKIFNEVVYNQEISTAKSNTAYIYCNVILPEYDVNTDKKIFNFNTKFNVNNSNIFQGTVMFYSKTQYIGCYNDINNILYLIDVISPNSQEFVGDVPKHILNEIINIIETVRYQHSQEIKNQLKVKSQSKLMLGGKIYDLTTNDVKLAFLDRLIQKMRKGLDLLSVNNIVYHVKFSNEQDIGLDSYKGQIVEKAQKVINSYRQKYFEDTQNFKQTYKSTMNSSIPMPSYSPSQIAKAGLMMAVDGDKIIYMFRVDIKVHSVINETSEKYVKLPEPVSFKNGLLIIITNQSGSLIRAQFKHKNRHYHVDAEDDICLGSAATKISNTRINSFNDILKVKNSIIEMMSVCNTHSMFSKAYKADYMETVISNARTGSLNNMIINSDEEK